MSDPIGDVPYVECSSCRTPCIHLGHVKRKNITVRAYVLCCDCIEKIPEDMFEKMVNLMKEKS